jgi:hypothetical protein
VTVIAGLVDGPRVIIGGDSAGLSGYDLSVRADSKTFTLGQFGLGFAGSFRAGQLLRHAFQPPPLPDNPEDLDQFMATVWVDALRDTLTSGGAAIDWSGEERIPAVFLVGVRGRLLEIQSDYQVGEAACGYSAIGCGSGPALGALHATAGLDMSAENRIAAALMAAERHSAGVRGPFAVVTV